MLMSSDIGRDLEFTLLTWVIQATFIVLLSLFLGISQHGGGTHQWNVMYKDVQYNWRVGLDDAVFLAQGAFKTVSDRAPSTTTIQTRSIASLCSSQNCPSSY